MSMYIDFLLYTGGAEGRNRAQVIQAFNMKWLTEVLYRNTVGRGTTSSQLRQLTELTPWDLPSSHLQDDLVSKELMACFRDN